MAVLCASLLLAVPAGAATTTTTSKSTTTTTTVRRPPASTTTTTTTSAEAARQQAITAELNTLRQQVVEASATEAAVLDQLDEVAGKRRSIESELAAMDAEIATVEAELEAANGRLTSVTNDLARAEVKLMATEGELVGAKTELADRAIGAYIHQPSAQLASVLLERQTYRELAAARDFLKSVAEAQSLSVGRYQNLRDTISGERTGLVADRDEVAKQKELVTFQRDQLVAARSRQTSLRGKALSEEGRQKTLLTDARGRVREFEAEIAALKKESDLIGALLRARQKAQAKAPTGSGVLSRPVDGALTSGFGPRKHPIFGTMRMHLGMDFVGASGTPVRAPADATVVVAGDRGGYGTTVILDHGNTLATLYAHLSRTAVTEGSTVSRGTVIGYVGSTGLSTGPHLHFEVRANGNPVDPARYL